ncbi:MAG: oxygen-independent coproporphyrinogen III oxidase [Archangium sp.]|nr:oxygen-independent coproporphyrinogen III oxidase [Archangium sp.]
MNALQLLAKYDIPGPRYTSYPTVPYWGAAPTGEQWFSHLERAIAKQRAGALYVHIPFCRSLCHYCGCNTVITRDVSVSDPYVESVLAEWKLYVQRLGRIRLAEIHLGGGTPTYLTAAQLQRLMSGILEHVDLEPGAELGFEADPRVASRDQLEVLAKLGFKRLSLGIQDFDPAVQFAVNRPQSVEEVRVVTEVARELGYDSINFDLIYGLPKQTPEGIERTVKEVRALAPDRLAFYGYAHVPWMKTFQRKFEDADVPAGAAKRSLYELGRGLLLEAGYREIGLDHFALPTDGLWRAFSEKRMHRNFMGYTEHETMPLFALGVSAIGDTWTAYAQNEKAVAPWAAAIARGELPIVKGHLLDDEDLLLRRHILEVMTRFETRWEPGTLMQVGPRLRELANDGLIELTASSVAVTDAGKPFVRNVCMAFDERLARKAPDKQLFSRTV